MKYGLIGERLGHSYSKPIHEALCGYEYEIREIERGALSGFLEAREFEAINVTIPYKELVIPHLDFVDGAAGRIGAVNTVVNRGGKLYGYNTDLYGMCELFRHAGIDPSGKKAAVLGTGGTSKTARACLMALGASEIVTVSRRSGGGAVSYDELYERHSDVRIIVNTTPLGMYPNPDGCPIDLKRLGAVEGVIDAVYNPLVTELILSARERGIKAEGGLYMLVAQAVRASEIFFDKEYPKGTAERIYKKIYAEKENIVLIGMPSSGKSTVGRIIAERLSRELVDSDTVTVKNEGMDIPAIFAKRGEGYFRDAESAAIKECANASGRVIATGGGAVLREENVRALGRSSRLYFIDRPLEHLIPTADRPLSKSREAIEKMHRERYPIYTAVCDAHIDGSGSPEEVADRIIKEFCK